MVEFDLDRSAQFIDRDRLVESAMAYSQVIQGAQGGPSEVAQFGVVTLGLKFSNDDDRNDYFVFGKTGERGGIGQQNTGVQNIRLAPFILALCQEVPALSLYVRVLGRLLPDPGGPKDK